MPNRLSGLFVFLFGLLLFFVVIPQQTETVGYGWLRPATLPSIAAVVIAIAGVAQLFRPKGDIELDKGNALRSLFFLCLSVAGLWAMDSFGFVLAGPAMMLVIMLSIGERRWLWLMVGVIFLPAFIWFCLDFLLKRPLP